MTNLLIRLSNGVYPIVVVERTDTHDPKEIFSGSVEWVFYGIACEKGDRPPIMKYVIKKDDGKTVFHGEFSVYGSVCWMWELLQIDEMRRRVAEEHFTLAITPFYQERNGSNNFVMLKKVEREMDEDMFVFNQWGATGKGNNTDKSDLSAEDAGKDGYGDEKKLDFQYRMTAKPPENQSGTIQ